MRAATKAGSVTEKVWCYRKAILARQEAFNSTKHYSSQCGLLQVFIVYRCRKQAPFPYSDPILGLLINNKALKGPRSLAKVYSFPVYGEAKNTSPPCPVRNGTVSRLGDKVNIWLLIRLLLEVRTRLLIIHTVKRYGPRKCSLRPLQTPSNIHWATINTEFVIQLVRCSVPDGTRWGCTCNTWES